jgi:hypothetical protein
MTFLERFDVPDNIANNVGDADGTTPDPRWTARGCPPDYNVVIAIVGITAPSRVDARKGPTLQRRVLVPNPQHLLLTLNIETSLHEEKCPL